MQLPSRARSGRARFIHIAAGLIASVALAFGTASCDGPGAQSPSLGAPPDFTLQALDGSTVHLADHLGKEVILIDFWSTTCEPCLQAMPHLVDLYKKHKEEGFIVFAISIDGPESRAQVSSIVNAKEMIFPIPLDEETAVVAQYNPKRELPFSVVVDKNGSIVYKRAGFTPGSEEQLVAAVEKAVANK